MRECKEIMSSLDKDESHNWEHSLRVRDLCLKISHGLCVCTDTIKVISYLHDIGRTKARGVYGNKGHAQISYEMATKILKRVYVPQKELILCVVRKHSELNNDNDNLCLKVFKDADRLDHMGAIGIYRIVHATTNHENFLSELNDAMKCFEALRMPIAISIGKPRYKFLVDFKKRFLKEGYF
jgi:putative nucleotidyltransferase with HDIG domain